MRSHHTQPGGNAVWRTGTVSPQEIAELNMSPEEMHHLALQNLERFASDPNGGLSIKMIGAPGDEVNFVLLSDHARAAACLRWPQLYHIASTALESTALCAIAPQREALIVFPPRDQTYRQMIIGKIREIEAEARRPISFEVFALTPDGVLEYQDC